MTFDKERFVNFAKYDLTINKIFLRNMTLVTIAGFVGIAMLGFMLRYGTYQQVVENTQDWSTPPEPGDFAHYTWNYLTALYEGGFILLMMSIFAGCWAHNLRNKQGRITELTLPATNLEKFTWHALLMLVGGFVVCFLSLLLADGLNALLTLMMFGADEGVGSLTQSIGECITLTMSPNDIFDMATVTVDGEEAPVSNSTRLVLISFTYLFIATCLCEITTFFYGNALKYKYNIILTYIVIQVISTIASIGFFIFSIVTAADAIETVADADMDNEDVGNLFAGIFFGIGTLAFALSALFVWWSYRRYTKAQITSSLNK